MKNRFKEALTACKKLHTLLLTLSLLMPHALNSAVTATIIEKKEKTATVQVRIDIAPDDFIYKDYLDVAIIHESCTNPSLQNSPWHTQCQAESFYDAAFQETKQIFKGPFTCTLQADTSSLDRSQDLSLHITYYAHNKKGPLQETVLLPLHQQELATALDVVTTEYETPAEPIVINQSTENSEKQGNALHEATDDFTHTLTHERMQDTEAFSAKHDVTKNSPTQKTAVSWGDYVGTLVKTTESLLVRIFLALLLGLLVSFTPCIYPMIPITIGILQAQKQSSVFNNFLVSLSYVMGIAVTFSCLGLLAAYTGQLFGTLVTNPIVIGIIVAIMIYLAGSMFGFYEMYIPRFMQSHRTMSRRGSLISAFIFGAISGTVASPCLSPGLLLLLTVVSTLGSSLAGFAMLFAFGVGLGLPLLIIGTFSGSLSMLPRAGMWMIEVKKVFGFLLLGVCFYFIAPLVSEPVLYAGLSAFLAIVGITYIYDTRNTHSFMGKLCKTGVGFAALILTVLVAAKATKIFFMEKEKTQHGMWINDYAQALDLAQQHNKKLFVCFSSPACSLCKKIDATMFQHPRVCESLESCVTVKLDGSDASDALCCKLQQEHKVMGFPTYLLLDQETGKLVKQWGGELYGSNHEEFIEDLRRAL
jgi:thiol:disulfide interchange protein DsbD